MEILVRPLDTVVPFNAGETLLKTLQRNQLPISYSCEDGRCGLCRCTLIQETSSIDLQNPLRSSVLACQTVLKDYCTVELPEPENVVVHPARVLGSIVVAVEPLARDVRLVRLKIKTPFAFSPGQYAEVHWERGLVRPYSMASGPDDGEIHFHVRLHRRGRASDFVENLLKPGAPVRLRGPLGSCHLRRHHQGPVLIVSSGTGLAPLLSVMREWERQRMMRPVRIFAGFTMVEEVYGLRELADLRTRISSMRLNIMVGQGPPPKGTERGLVTEAEASELGSLAGWEAYVYGSPHAVDATTRLLESKGIDKQRLHADPFHFSGT